MKLRKRTAVLWLSLADATVLLGVRPPLGQVCGALAHPHARLAELGVDGAAADLAGTALWLGAGWLALALLALAAATLPGPSGRLARRGARLVVPPALYRLVAGAAGLGITLAPAPALAGSAAVGAGGAAVPSTAASPVPPAAAPTWPGDRVPTPAWPTSPAPVPPARPPTPAAASTAGTHGANQPPQSVPRTRVVVRPGDSLWTIAATSLPPHASAARIAHTWPQWYAANRARIGTDPDHLVPGCVLHAPAPVADSENSR